MENKLPELNYVGLCHYKRYLNLFEAVFRKEITPNTHYLSQKEFYNTAFFNKGPKTHEQRIKRYLKNHNIITCRPTLFLTTVKEHYENYHNINDLDLCNKLVTDLYPEYKTSIKEYYETKYLYVGNLFITNTKFLNTYCHWLFSILFALEKIITPSTDFYQQRVFAFLSKRLYSLYLYHTKPKIKHVETYFIEAK